MRAERSEGRAPKTKPTIRLNISNKDSFRTKWLFSPQGKLSLVHVSADILFFSNLKEFNTF